MKKSILQINQPPWSDEDIIKDLENFKSIYNDRPIKDNKGGMLFSHVFYFYFVLKKINPELVIESGVFKGQSTWLIEKTLPNSKIISIDLNLSKREYISKNATYSNIDFKFQKFSKIPKNSLVFFDDHVNHLDRIVYAKFFNIKHVIFEDNYSINNGDFQTIKQFYLKNKFNHKPGFMSLVKTFFKFGFLVTKKILNLNSDYKKELNLINDRIRDGHEEFEWMENIFNNVNCYYEFPPLFNVEHLDIDQIKKPLINKFNKEFKDNYNFFTYICLN